MRQLFFLMCLAIIIGGTGCTTNVKLFPDAAEPLLESTIQGHGLEKVLVINIQGIITDISASGFFKNSPSLVQEVVSQLRKCEADPAIKAVILKIDSPGGTVSASDLLYHEILTFKQRTGKKVVAMMMNVAASGGYYVALPADEIVAQPATITGSIGALFPDFKYYGLLEKIGVELSYTKSGRNKDMHSGARPSTDEENKIVQDIVDAMGRRFMRLVKQHRRINAADMDKITSARVFLAQEAQELGLIDKVGYLDEAIRDTGRMAGLANDFKVVVYRRSVFKNDNLYNTTTSKVGTKELSLLNVGTLNPYLHLNPGCYYLWLP